MNIARLRFRLALTLLGTGVGLFAGLGFLHRCFLGIYWVEAYLPYGVAVLCGGIVFFVNKYRWSLLAAGSLFAVVYFGLAPWYGDYVHDNKISIGKPSPEMPLTLPEPHWKEVERQLKTEVSGESDRYRN